MLGIDISGFLCDNTSDFGSRAHSANMWSIYGVPQALPANTLHATPRYFVNPTLIDNLLLFHLGTVANIRCGIYLAGNVASTTNGVYPGVLLVDGGQVTVSNVFGVWFSWAVNVTIPANTLLYLVALTDTTNSCVNVPGLAESGTNLLGNTYSALGVNHPVGISHTQTYGPLPGTFPTSSPIFEPNPVEVAFSAQTITPVTG